LLLQRLAAVAQSVQQAGEQFFDTLVAQLASLLGVARVEVWEVTDPERSRLRAVAIWDRGPQTYPDREPTGHDREVLENGQVVLPEAGYLGTRLVGSTGRVLGCLALLDQRPLDVSREPHLLVQVLAPLAAAELERRQLVRGQSDRAGADGDLLAAAIHEWRDPLSGLVNAADVLRQTPGPDQQAQWAAQVVDRQTRYLVGLTDDLSAACDLARGKVELQLESVDVEQLVRQAIDLVRPELALRRQELKLETALGPVPVRGDRIRLLQAIHRMLDDAIRQAGVGGALNVSVRSTGAQATVLLIGPPGTGDQARERPERPRLGLMLLRRLIRQHGGTVTTGAPAPGAPLEIEVQLPITTAAAPARPRPTGITSVPLSPRRVMVVDDEHDSAHALGMALNRRGHQVCIVHNGKAALDALPGFRPEAVLLDIGLPGLDGLDVARCIRAMPDHEHITLIAATGFGWADDRRRSLQAGFDHHLVKPLALEDVEAVLAEGRPSGPRPDGGT
jgi:CheY-like chemotaxis protein